MGKILLALSCVEAERFRTKDTKKNNLKQKIIIRKSTSTPTDVPLNLP